MVINDSSHYRFLRRYSQSEVANKFDFIECVVDEMSLPIQHTQAARARKFFVRKVSKQLMIYGAKFRPNNPDFLHPNRKWNPPRKRIEASYIQL